MNRYRQDNGVSSKSNYLALNLRRRIAGLFVLFSTFVYVTLTLSSMYLFHIKMIDELDHELRILGASLGHAIDVKDGTPFFRDWLRVVQTNPARSLATIQLYDRNGKLLEAYGPKGFEQLRRGLGNATFNDLRLRTLTTEVTTKQGLVGYMQLELPTQAADDATRQFAWTMGMVSPLVFAGLIISSLIVSKQVVRPFEENLNSLRRFIADAGHELNTPLSIMQARLESLQKKLASQDIQHEDVPTMERALGRMGKIVKDLSLLTEVEGPLAGSPKVEIDLSDMIARAVEDTKVRFMAKNIELQFMPAPAVVAGYPDALHRLISNLLENALRYTDEGGKVTVQVIHEDKTASIRVSDTGIGIPAESLPLIFDRFYRVDKSRSRASGGVGLGLSIVKAIAEAHNGSVSVESQPGAGTTFNVRLPLVR